MSKVRVYEVIATNGHGTRTVILPGDSAAALRAQLETNDVAITAKFKGWAKPQPYSDGPNEPVSSFNLAGVNYDQQYDEYAFKYLCIKNSK